MEEINLEQLKRKRMTVLDVADQDIIGRAVKAARIHFEAIADLITQKPIDEDSISIHQEAIEYLTTPVTAEYIDITRLQVVIESMQRIKRKGGGNTDDMLCLANRSQFIED